jgi:hypothetical protein
MHILAQPDRRRYRRFPIPLKLSYTLASRASGEGEISDISSGGLHFRCGAILPVGKRINVVAQWPFFLDGTCPLKLCIRGWVLRSNHRGTAIELERYEFRTARGSAARAAKSAAPAAIRRDDPDSARAS